MSESYPGDFCKSSSATLERAPTGWRTSFRLVDWCWSEPRRVGGQPEHGRFCQWRRRSGAKVRAPVGC